MNVEPGMTEQLRQLSVTPPTDTTEFLHFLLTSRQRFREAMLVSTLPPQLSAPIAELLDRRSTMRHQKEQLVNQGRFDEASQCLAQQQTLTDELHAKLEGHNLSVNIDHVTATIEQFDWPKN